MGDEGTVRGHHGIERGGERICGFQIWGLFKVRWTVCDTLRLAESRMTLGVPGHLLEREAVTRKVP